MKLMFALFVITGIAFISLNMVLSGESIEQTYQTHQVKKGDLNITNTVTGNFESDTRFLVRSSINAELKQVLISEGDRVKAGDVLFKLDCQKHRLAERNVQIAISKAKESLEYYQVKRSSIKRLTEVGGRAGKELNDLDYKVSELKFEQQKLQNDLRQALLTLQNCAIKSPISGVVSNLSIHQGQYISAGENLAELLGTSNKSLESYVNEFDVQVYQVGQPISASLSEYSKKRYQGKIAKISQIVSNRNGSNVVKVTFTIDFSDGMDQVRLGQQAIIDVETHSYKDVLIVPRDYISSLGKDMYVEVMKDGVVKKQLIMPVGGDYLNIGVRQGLSENTLLVKQLR